MPSRSRQGEGAWNTDLGPCIECGGPAWLWKTPAPRQEAQKPAAEVKKQEAAEGGKVTDSSRSGAPPPSREKHCCEAEAADSCTDRAALLTATPTWPALGKKVRPEDCWLQEIARRMDLLAQQVGTCVQGLEEVQRSVSSLPSRVVDEWAEAADADMQSLSRLSGKRTLHSSDVLKSPDCSLVSMSRRRSPVQSKMGALSESEEPPLEEVVMADSSEMKSLEPKDVEEPVVDGRRVPKTSRLKTLKSFRCSLSIRISNGVHRLQRPRRGLVVEALWRFLEEPNSGKAAWLFHKIWAPVIFLTVIASVVQSLNPPPIESRPAWVMEVVFDSIFAAECIARIYASPNIIVYLYSMCNVIDLLAALPLIGRLLLGPDCVPHPGQLPTTSKERLAQALICLSPTLRLLKTLRRFQQFHLFVAILSFTQEALQFLLLTLVMIMLLFSALIYLAEQAVNSNLGSLPDAMWLTVVTLTTVGYGDMSPETGAGRLICFVLILGSVLFMAMPIGIIGNAFTEKWKDRDRIMMRNRFQNRILQCGYTVQDVVPMFTQFDMNNNGELSLSEFIEMVVEMQLGLQEDSAIEIFEMIDKNGSGGIDCREFVREFFPSKFYHEIYGHGYWSPGEWVKEKVRQRKERFAAQYARRRKRRDRPPHELATAAGGDITSEARVQSPQSEWRQQMVNVTVDPPGVKTAG